LNIYKNGWFEKFARKEGISDAALCDAIERVDDGLIDADLGAGLIKQRVAREGGGKSGGFRTIILFKMKTRAVFVYGFAKSDRGNLEAKEVVLYRKLARVFLSLNEAQMTVFVEQNKWTKVVCHDKNL